MYFSAYRNNLIHQSPADLDLIHFRVLLHRVHALASQYYLCLLRRISRINIALSRGVLRAII